MADKKNILLVIDFQTQFKDKNLRCEIVKDFIKSQQSMYDEIIFTVFSQYSLDSETEYHDGYHKNLDWDGCRECNAKDLIIDIELELTVPARVFVKNTYAADIPKDLSPDNCHIDLIGCDADSCVLATAFNLWDKQYNFNIPFEYIYTTAPKYDYKQLKMLYKRNFGNVVI